MFDEPTSIKELLFACSFLDDSDDENDISIYQSEEERETLKTPEGRARFTSFSHNLSFLSDDEALLNFGFTSPHIHRLAKALRMPSPFTTFPVPLSSLEALSVALYFLRNPSRNTTSQMCQALVHPVFDLMEDNVAYLVRGVLDWIRTKWGGLLEGDPTLLSKDKLEEYCSAVRKRTKKNVVGSGKGVIWGFVGTSSWEMEEFKGKQKLKKKGVVQLPRKSLQYQTLLLPNGLFAHASGGWRPCSSPASIFDISGLPDLLSKHSKLTDQSGARKHLAIYSDLSRPGSPFHFGPFEKDGDGKVDRAKELANNEMENMRRYVDVEMEEMGKNWQLLKDRRSTVIDGSPNGLFFFAALLFQNAKCCLSETGNETAQFFKIQPPSLEKYFHDQVPPPRVFRGKRKEAPERFL